MIWEEIYQEIREEFGYSEIEDQNAARQLMVLMTNSDLIDDDEFSLKNCDVVIFGPSNPSFDNLDNKKIISAGSATELLINNSIIPDVVVTDLDGDIESQIYASNNGALSFIHAHGDNTLEIQKYAPEFKGPVILTTQSTPNNIIRNYGGFTDGDRAVIVAKHFGANSIELRGFDFENPCLKDGSDVETKRKKLKWAKKIISFVLEDDCKHN